MDVMGIARLIALDGGHEVGQIMVLSASFAIAFFKQDSGVRIGEHWTLESVDHAVSDVKEHAEALREMGLTVYSTH